MLSVMLFVLKLVGIILLVLLSLVLLILGLVLFAPIKYKGSGSKYGENLQVQALVTYLNPIVRVLVQYPGAHIVQVKICGFVIFKTGDETEEEKPDESIPKTIKEKETPSSENNTVVEQECRQQEIVQEKSSTQPSSISNAGEQSVSHDVCVEEKAGTTKTATTEGETATAKEVHDAHSVVAEQTDLPKDSVVDTIGYYYSLFQENKDLILEVIKIVFRALKTIMPRKCRIKAVYGAGEADKTGFIYAAYCALEVYLPGKVTFEPVWTEKFAEGEFELKGKIRIIHFLVAAIKIIANPRVSLLIKKIRRV